MEHGAQRLAVRSVRRPVCKFDVLATQMATATEGRSVVDFSMLTHFLV